MLTPSPTLVQQHSNEQEPSTTQKKKKKKRSSLSNSRQASSNQADLTWLLNTETNRQLKRGDSSKQATAGGEATPWSYKLNSELTSIDDVYERFHNGYYHSLEAIEEALCLVFERAEQRCLNTLARNYIDKVRSQSLSLLKRRSELKNRWLAYFHGKFELTASQQPRVT